MSAQNLILQKFSEVKILVVGDVMLDRYWWGDVERISPEAPVPVVNLKKTSLVAGGAANVAANISGLGAHAFLVGAIGEDEESELFPAVLKSENVSTDYLVKIKNRPTTIKTRVVAHNQHVVRIDKEKIEELDASGEKKIWSQIKKVIKNVSAIVVSDYGKGVLTENLLMRLITTAGELKKPILIDPKGKNYKKYSGATILTPNRREALTACGLEENGQEKIENAGKMLLDKIDLDAVLITQGESGMTLFRQHKKPFHLEALARQVYDVTGAGDTVIATLGVAVGAGENLETAAELANIAAGIVVEEVGTTIISSEKLAASFEK